jgi:hypothetical protein
VSARGRVFLGARCRGSWRATSGRGHGAVAWRLARARARRWCGRGGASGAARRWEQREGRREAESKWRRLPEARGGGRFRVRVAALGDVGPWWAD